jgi:glycosyltransferase involved in cell wall biosynthesis
VSAISLLVLLPDEGGIRYHAFGTVTGAQQRGANVASFEVGHNMSLAELIRLARKATLAAKQHSYLYVEIGRNEGTTLLVALICSWLSRKRLNVLAHDGPMLTRSPGAYLSARRTRFERRLAYRLLSPLLSTLLRQLFIWRVDRWFVTTDVAKNEMEDQGLLPCFVMHSGIEDPVSYTSPANGRAVVVPGYLGPTKGTDVAIHAWITCQADIDFYLHIIGNTHEGNRPWANSLLEMLQQSGRPYRWTVDTATDSEFQCAIANAAIVLVPYRDSNPASGVVVRSIVEGRCIVGTSVPAVTSEVDNRVSGIVLSDADPQLFAEAIELLIKNPSLRDSYGERARLARGLGRRWVDQFDSIALHFN